uniref:C-type lectin domain-containing protein n=1 Tax=Paramormyrops kingsleyae TaxID=1676925 RepID=A0A3B3SJ57_9TELE
FQLVGVVTEAGCNCNVHMKSKEYGRRCCKCIIVSLAVLCVTLFIARVCDPCPQGWEKHNGQCYYFSTSVTTWNESQNNCIKEAAHLVTVNSEEEQVTGLISQCCVSHSLSSYWIGLTDSAEEGVWRWVDGTDLNVQSTRTFLKSAFFHFWRISGSDTFHAFCAIFCFIC